MDNIPKVKTKQSITGSFMVACPFCKDLHFFILKNVQIAALKNSVPDSHMGSINMTFQCPKTKSDFLIVALES